MNYEKETKLNWEGFDIVVVYDTSSYPEIMVLDVIYEDNPMLFLEKVSKTPNFIDDITNDCSIDYTSNWCDEIAEGEDDDPYLDARIDELRLN